MIIKIQKLIVQTYGELLKEKTRKLLGDLFIVISIVFSIFWIRSLTEDKIITLLNVSYRLDVLLFYLLGIVLILSTSVLFSDFRNFLNITSTFIITRFPRMKGDFTPGKMILRDMVQIFILFLVLYPVSESVKEISLHGVQLIYVVSLFFLVFCFIFLYHILKNVIKIINSHYEKLVSLIAKKNKAL
jgi:hypothetical protein